MADNPDLGLAIIDACEGGKSLSFHLEGDELCFSIVDQAHGLRSDASVFTRTSEVIADELYRAARRLLEAAPSRAVQTNVIAITHDDAGGWIVVRGDGSVAMRCHAVPTILWGDAAREFVAMGAKERNSERDANEGIAASVTCQSQGETGDSRTVHGSFP